LHDATTPMTMATMKQLGLGLKLSTKKTRKRELLEEMERVVPWAALVQIVAPYYPKAKTGRPPFGIETMLRIHYLQQWFGLSDPAMEEALHDVPLYREFAKLDGVTGSAARRDDDPALQAPAGASQPGGRHAAPGQRHPAGQGHDDAHGHGCGCDADLGAELDQER
jgi:IS5 family transposase